MQYIKHSQADSYLPFLGCDLVMASLLLFLGLPLVVIVDLKSCWPAMIEQHWMVNGCGGRRVLVESS
jgi:hypothetical protein